MNSKDHRYFDGGRAGHLLLTLFLAIPSATTAASYTVDRFDDDPSAMACVLATPADCSLRGAIRAANANAGADTIILRGDGTYTLTIAGAEEEFAQTGDLDVRGPLTIITSGPGTPVIHQTTTDRVFHTSVLFGSPGAFTITGPLIIVGGTAVNSAGQALGGSIYAFRSGSVTLEDVVLMDGNAPDSGGCLYFANPTPAGVLNLTDVRITGCTAGNSGGGLFAQTGDSSATLTRVEIDNNQAGVAAGGLRLFGGSATAVVIESTIRNNLAGPDPGSVAFGGGAYLSSGSVSLLRSTVADNRAGTAAGMSGRGGGLFIENAAVLIQNSTISGNQSLGSSFGTGSAVESSGSTIGVEFSTVVDRWVSGFESIRATVNSAITFETSILQARCFATSGTFTSAGLNAEKPIDAAVSTTCGLVHVSDVFTTAPLLKPLAGYGGPTTTHALLDSAPAILPAVPSGTCNDPVGGPIDQRAAPKTGLFCEPGSFEHGSLAPGPWIFSDGFESGDTAAWSSAVP